ncbi:MAG: GatB/YqeY domain-containing protein [Bacteroidota bacterium]
MELEKLINDDIKATMMARNAEKLEALRAIKAALLLEKTKEGTTGEIPDTVELKLLQKLVKQRKESAEIYQGANRQDLADKELFEASIIEKYLPQQLPDEEVKRIIQKIITDSGASSMKEMGKVMGLANQELSGKADNKLISFIVKELLSK